MKNKNCIICGNVFYHRKNTKLTCSKECSYKARILSRNRSRFATEGSSKRCEKCNLFFIDATRDQKKIICYDCVIASMVQTRVENGSYVRTEQQNKKLSETLKKKIENGWVSNSPEHLEKLSRLMSERWKSGRMKNTDKPHWTQTPEGKDKLSKKFKNRKFKPETINRMRIAAGDKVRKGLLKYHRGRGGVREDLGFYVRSSWEANFARILKFEGKNFEYESKTFQLEDGTTYTPDFRVDGIYYEIKGYMTNSARRKIESFIEEYPDYELKIIDYEKYLELKQKFESLINWEKSK